MHDLIRTNDPVLVSFVESLMKDAGIGCLVADFQRTGETPYGLLDRFKRQPSVAPLIEGSEVKEYAAHPQSS